MTHAVPQSLSSCKITKPLTGRPRVPGDKSISHRALILGGLAIGETIISGLLESADVRATASAMRALGALVMRESSGLWRVQGRGVGGLSEPSCVLDMGNSGTSARLLMGVVAGHAMTACFAGDASLSKRPMGRVLEPLSRMGARYLAREGGRLPLAIAGTSTPLPIEYETPVASAQIKSAILLAGLCAPGQTVVIEAAPTRDHTENMLRHFGATVEVDGKVVHLSGQPELQGCALDVPADPSAAAFPALAALLCEGSDITLPGVCVNPRRDGFFRAVKDMGADVAYTHSRTVSGEAVADIVVRGQGPLKGIDLPAHAVPDMIDEIPALAMLAACARGTTRLVGLSELRVKESDRLAAVAKGLAACGVRIEEGPDSLTIHGSGQSPQGGALIETALDHRIAMSFLCLGCATKDPISIDDGSAIDTSFPHFVEVMNALGADITSGNAL